MIHIATVHWKTDKWIDIQLNYLKKHIQSEYRVYAFLNEVPAEHNSKFYYVSTEPIEEHAIKLNLLAERISWEANKDDLIIFLDGDAFPINDSIVPFIESNLKKHKLIAIQRLECHRDSHPHPSFCATTLNFWKDINGDWNKGYTWKDEKGLIITDVGGNLLLQLQQLNIDWLPLHRSNKNNLHTLWFGIYADLIYHHGAGFRLPLSRVDRGEGGFLINFLFKLTWILKTIVALIERKYNNMSKSIVDKNIKKEETFYKTIEEDEFFFKKLL